MQLSKHAAALLFASALSTHSGGALAETVTASWYHAHRAGDVASNTYRIGTRLSLYNQRTGARAVGTVAGTGPFVPGVFLDVSRQIAEALGFKRRGKTPITITRLGR
jgi:rare lipoprotein A (peptidoglycan hydrolase)